VSARVLADYGATHYAFARDPAGLVAASGARDTFLGARLTLRLEL
jgi:hypothetical protein